ncbi:mitochondrial ribosomal protein S18C [Nomia melanderi]|uniref:mitochondrial ribosomal protein S18C n=1 Tax=Nomia melanderi TaxID=2448451 RepID=UPI001304715F|nr:28S ribosomal protein S18c, mitochondrial [Nomia melanderi]
MISALATVRSLKNITNKLPVFLYRNRSNGSSVSCNEATDTTADPDLPSVFENPYTRERRLCILCKLKITPNYKNVRLLSQFQSRHTGKIYGKHITGLCDHQQRKVEEEIVKAQQAGLMGYMTKEPKFFDDPELFNPNRPLKAHPY